MIMTCLQQPCYPLSAVQLREMWDFDNRCGSEIMGVPLRVCSSVESGEEGDGAGVTSEEFQQMKHTVKSMWQKASTLLEVFMDENQPVLGYRLRVKCSLPISVKFSECDRVLLGWSATAPNDDASPCSHLYRRSPMKKQGYLGGPLSYLNWGGKKSNATVIRSYKGPETYFVFLQSGRLKPGIELLWDYGSKSSLPDYGKWFFEDVCCNIMQNQRPLKPMKIPSNLEYMNKECCVLCGKQFSVSKGGRIQRKPHFIDSHADYLGTDWDGVGKYDGEFHKVDGNRVLIQADTLNSFISELIKLKWKVIPACNILNTTEKKKLTKKMLILKNRCRMLRKHGILQTRGTSEALVLEHLEPIAPSKWSALRWKTGTQPQRGHYGLPSDQKEELTKQIKENVQQYIFEILGHDSDSDSS